MGPLFKAKPGALHDLWSRSVLCLVGDLGGVLLDDQHSNGMLDRPSDPWASLGLSLRPYNFDIFWSSLSWKILIIVVWWSLVCVSPENFWNSTYFPRLKRGLCGTGEAVFGVEANRSKTTLWSLFFAQTLMDSGPSNVRFVFFGGQDLKHDKHGPFSSLFLLCFFVTKSFRDPWCFSLQKNTVVAGVGPVGPAGCVFGGSHFDWPLPWLWCLSRTSNSERSASYHKLDSFLVTFFSDQICLKNKSTPLKRHRIQRFIFLETSIESSSEPSASSKAAIQWPALRCPGLQMGRALQIPHWYRITGLSEKVREWLRSWDSKGKPATCDPVAARNPWRASTTDLNFQNWF